MTQEQLTKNYENDEAILLAVDCILFGVRDGKLNLLIFEREVEPLAGHWSLVGSFVRKHEDLDNAAKRVLMELTGLTDIYMEQLHCFGNSDRDPGARVVSVAYWSLIRIDQNDLNIEIDNHKSKWVEFEHLPSLILDHQEMIEKAISHLRERSRFHPIGFELLPDEFTMRQLLEVYEAIFNTNIDDRNFRKKIFNSGLLIPLDKKDKTTSKKGSFLYRFDEKRYEFLQENGFNFDFNF